MWLGEEMDRNQSEEKNEPEGAPWLVLHPCKARNYPLAKISCRYEKRMDDLRRKRLTMG